MATTALQYSLSEASAPQPTPVDALAALAIHANQLVSSELTVEQVVERIGSLALYSLRAESVRIVLQSLETGKPQRVEFAERRGPAGAGAPEFVFSRNVAAGGVEYGVVEIALHPSSWSVTALLDLAGTLVDLLAQRARRDELRSRNAALRLQLARFEQERQFDILLARASGVVAADHGWSAEQARTALVEEARRGGVPIKRYAERIVLGHILRSRALRSRPGQPLRRTA
jgi:hypothetical protein